MKRAKILPKKMEVNNFDEINTFFSERWNGKKKAVVKQENPKNQWI